MRTLFLILFPALLWGQKAYYFSGSDWCLPCIKFQKALDNDAQFDSLIRANFGFWEQVDFPQRTKKIPKAELARRDSLAALYNPKGTFPLIAVVQQDGTFKTLVPTAKDLASVYKIFPPKETLLTQSRRIMGNAFGLTVNDYDAYLLDTSWKILEQWEGILSSWKMDSQIGVLNQNAGIQPVKLDSAVFYFLTRVKGIYELTNGAFDPSVKPLLKIWDTQKGVVPDTNLIMSNLALVGFDRIVFDFDSMTVFLPDSVMALDLGGIGKGFAAMELKAFWLEKGIKKGAINASGDVYFIGRWPCKIRNPFGEEIVWSFMAENEAVVTSGDYEKYFEINGIRYTHIVNPKTGFPVQGITSVTVITASAELADALATSVIVMGENEGLKLINSLKGVECVIILSNGEVLTSEGITIQ